MNKYLGVAIARFVLAKLESRMFHDAEVLWVDFLKRKLGLREGRNRSQSYAKKSLDQLGEERKGKVW